MLSPLFFEVIRCYYSIGKRQKSNLPFSNMWLFNVGHIVAHIQRVMASAELCTGGAGRFYRSDKNIPE